LQRAIAKKRDNIDYCTPNGV